MSYDFSALAEQLPDLLDGLRSGSGAEIDLYSEGIERTLTFWTDGVTVSVGCVSRTRWIPDPAVEHLPHAELLAMCTQLAHDFAASLAAVGSAVAELAPFNAWRCGTSGP